MSNDLKALITTPVDTELPDAAALTDANANPTTPVIGAAGLVWNDSVWERAVTIREMNLTPNLTGRGVQAVGLVAYNDAANEYYSLRTATNDTHSPQNVLGVVPMFINGANAVRVTGDTAGLDVDPSGHTKKVRLVPTVSASAIYAAGDAVGGLLTFTSIARASGGSGVIMSVTIADFANQKAELELWLFDQSFTNASDNAAAAYSAADLANIVGVIPIYASDYKSVGTRAIATVRAIGLPFVASGSANLYGQLVTRGTPTYGATSDIEVVLRALQD
ncbi:MAG: hypothetical protein NTZ05_12400 [Chloroflexi bacterium]|nr:hypothetical protein [Chloroflexota bacterium]